VNVSELWRYPVKSARGERLSTAVVEPWGLAGDRRWMVIDEGGSAITSREQPQLILMVPTVDGSTLNLEHPSVGSVVVRAPSTELVDVDVHGNPLQAALAVGADEFVTAVTGRPARLVYLDDPTRRRPNPARSKETDRVSLADAYPVELAASASLDALNDWIAEGPRAHEGPVPMMRFRPNIVVTGSPPWAEDGWRRVRIGSVEFRAVKASDRCVMTTVDPGTGVKGKEPITSLARHRRWDGKTWFAINLIPDGVGEVNEGDELEVLEAVDASEPQR
jgi:uncharacterized protein YcbX